MGKFFGAIGYAESIKTGPGKWSEVVTEQNYSGDVLKISNRWQQGDSGTDDLVPNHEISIVANPYAHENLPKMKYIKWNGVCWKITKFESQPPRLVLSIGGVYNGPKAKTPGTS